MSDSEVHKLAEFGRSIARHYGAPQDVGEVIAVDADHGMVVEVAAGAT